MKARCVAALYALGWAAVRRLPESWAQAVFRFLADIAWRRQGPGVQRLEANLRRVVPDATGKQLRALSRAGMRSYLRYWMETFRMPAYGTDRIRSGMRVTGYDALDARLTAGRGVVLALPHMGNYDHAGAWAALSGVPFTTVAERLEPESLFARFVAFRESLGMEVLARTGDGHVFGTLARRLRQGRLVCLLADRELGSGGVDVDFFGERARMALGPAALAVQTGAALMPATLWYDGASWCARVHEEIPVPDTGDRRAKTAAMTQAVADRFAVGIAEHPEDWHMLQKVFVADLDARPADPAGTSGARP